MITRHGTNNGFWVHSGYLWWSNEDTAFLKDHVDRRKIADLLARRNELFCRTRSRTLCAAARNESWTDIDGCAGRLWRIAREGDDQPEKCCGMSNRSLAFRRTSRYKRKCKYPVRQGWPDNEAPESPRAGKSTTNDRARSRPAPGLGSKDEFLPAGRCLEIHRLMVRARVMEERMIKMSKSGEGYFWIGGPGEEAFNTCLGLQVKKGEGPPSTTSTCTIATAPPWSPWACR